MVMKLRKSFAVFGIPSGGRGSEMTTSGMLQMVLLGQLFLQPSAGKPELKK